MNQQQNHPALEEKCPPFIRKLLQILENERNKSTIRFDRVKNRLEVVSKKKLERLLPKYFRHRNFESFSRQLNWYGFVKLRGQRAHIYIHPDLEQGGKLQKIKSKRISVRPPERDLEEENRPQPEINERNQQPAALSGINFLVKREPEQNQNPVSVNNFYPMMMMPSSVWQYQPIFAPNSFYGRSYF